MYGFKPRSNVPYTASSKRFIIKKPKKSNVFNTSALGKKINLLNFIISNKINPRSVFEHSEIYVQSKHDNFIYLTISNVFPPILPS